jgi:alkanesulfonate monooxygenase SsuD/methylene tetrahydromethanopterin reductase-like flavin-dependent oxidoreductase (luciferase family)
MRYGAHLPLVDLDGEGWGRGALASYTDAAGRLGYGFVSANDHLVFQRPWLDGIVALASVLEHAGDMQLATTVALPVVRGPAALAKAAAALDVLSEGRLVLGVGPGSSERDYETAGLDFRERWPRLDESLRVLRAHLTVDAPDVDGRFYATRHRLEPRPARVGGPPIWIGSWGSAAGLRRVARLGDGWLASAYNLMPERARAARATLGEELAAAGRQLDGFPCSLATMWTYVTEDRRAATRHLARLADLLNRPADRLGEQVLVGPPEECAARLQAYERAGFDNVFVWPLADAEEQLERVMRDVAPLVRVGPEPPP